MVWYPGKNPEIGNVFRVNGNVDTTISRLINYDKPLYPVKTGYTLQRYNSRDVITRQFKQPIAFNQLTKVTEYPTTNTQTGKVSRASLRDKLNE